MTSKLHVQRYETVAGELGAQTYPRNITSSLTRSVSPPPVSRSNRTKSSTALVEAGERELEDHLTFFSGKLQAVTIPQIPGLPRLDQSAWIDLYTRNCCNTGHHFVVHQHDHPIAGTHYDLRLQCNATSSISFAIMYGLPGDPNSRRLNRLATETRVHTLWNHLIETASHQTGSMLLWDTGEYEVLPYYQRRVTATTVTTEEEEEDSNDCNTTRPSRGIKHWADMTEQQKLRAAFQQRKLRLRLNGTKLPPGYTISLRLTGNNYHLDQPTAPKRRRRRASPGVKSGQPKKQKVYNTDSSTSADESSSLPDRLIPRHNVSSLAQQASLPIPRNESNSSSTSHDLTDPSHQVNKSPKFDTINGHSDDEGPPNHPHPSVEIHHTNAYPGAINDINSIHQRRWYLSLDRLNSGFIKTHTSTQSDRRSTRWMPRSSLPGHQGMSRIANDPAGFTAFHVLGRDHERSVLTGRMAGDVLADEGVKGYVPRGLWRAVTE